MRDPVLGVAPPPFSGAQGRYRTQARPDPKIYERYEKRYENPDNLYSELGQQLKNITARHLADSKLKSAIKTLRNPVHRIVEFYATVILTGTDKQAFPVANLDSTSPLAKAIWLVWQWSNFSQQKQLIKRWTAIYGQMFIQVYTPNDSRVNFNLIKPATVTDFGRDERGNITYIRMDTNFTKVEGGPPQEVNKTRTEIWRKEGKNGSPGYYRVWERAQDTSATTVMHEDSLSAGDLVTDLELSTQRPTADNDSLGFDFVPFVEIVAQATGQNRPVPVYHHALPLIDEQNKMATRLHDLLFRFNKPVKAIQGIGNDRQGRPMAAPRVEGQPENRDIVPFGGELASLLSGAKDDLTLDGDIMYGLPGNAQMVDVTPNIQYSDARNELLDQAEELAQESPELIYYNVKDKAQLSGTAIRKLIAGAIDRATEMRSNIENAVIKADKMALSIAQARGLPGFSVQEIGQYNNGDGFEHEFEEREILPLSDDELENTRKIKIANAAALVALGVETEAAMKTVGLDTDGLSLSASRDAVAAAAQALASRQQANTGGSAT